MTPRRSFVRPGLPGVLRTHLAAEPELIPPGSRVIVALSGGPDSTALLHLLSDLASDLDLRLEAAHFDHRVRTGSENDASLALDLAAGAGVPCHVGRPRVPPKANQACMRRARYRWLDAVVRDRSADRLAVGHHADDQAETVLFRMMRGTDLRGLAGIPAQRELIVRPLLPFRRWELRNYVESLGVQWLDDPSNTDLRWARSRLRAKAIPALESVAPGMVHHLVELGRAAARAYELSERAATALLLEAEVQQARPGRVELCRHRLARAGPELQAIALRKVARVHAVALTSGGTRAGVLFISEGRSGGRVMIGGGLQVSREFDRIVIAREAARPPADELHVHERAGGGSMRIGERKLELRWRPLRGGAPVPERIAVTVPPGHYPLMFRSWRNGDRIRLPGGTRKLKRLFGDRRIPVSERASLPVLADRLGNILWIDGLATAETDHGAAFRSSLLEFELRHE